MIGLLRSLWITCFWSFREREAYSDWFPLNHKLIFNIRASLCILFILGWRTTVQKENVSIFNNWRNKIKGKNRKIQKTTYNCHLNFITTERRETEMWLEEFLRALNVIGQLDLRHWADWTSAFSLLPARTAAPHQAKSPFCSFRLIRGPGFKQIFEKFKTHQLQNKENKVSKIS